MRRFSIRALMALVLFVAVSLAALRDANAVWSGSLLLVTLGLVGAAVLGAAHGPRRAGCHGFALFGGVYLALSVGPWLSEPVGEKLPTTQALAYVHSKVAAPHTYVVTLVASPGGTTANAITTLDVTQRSGSTIAFTGTAKPPQGPVSDPSAPNRWKSLFPGAANRDAFLTVGHCLFALTAGLLGAVIARRFEKRREREAAGERAPGAGA